MPAKQKVKVQEIDENEPDNLKTNPAHHDQLLYTPPNSLRINNSFSLGNKKQNFKY